MSPNTERDDILLALKLIFQPWRWKNENLKKYPGGEKVKSCSRLLEEEFKKYLGVKYAFSFNSGRSALMIILNSLGLEKNSEVLVQALTCNAVVNPILWSGLKPVYVDCQEKTFNIGIEDLKRKISPSSRVVMVQHTFGLPAELNEILAICQKNNLILIEDCAHSLGAEYLPSRQDFSGGVKKFCGTFGKAAFFSFGRDKVISSVYGGMAVTNDPVLAEKLKESQQKCQLPSYFWILQQLWHPVLTQYLIKPLYGFFGIGKRLLIFFQKLRILSKAVTEIEKQGKLPFYFPQKMPNALAALARHQFKKLEKFNDHRKKIAEIYDQELKELKIQLPLKSEGRIYMRYPLIIGDGETDKILKELEKSKIFLDDGWRKTPIVPADTDQEKMGYQGGSCPQAEKIAKNILNLPTHINLNLGDAQKIVTFLKAYGS